MTAPTKSIFFDGVNDFVDFGRVPTLINRGTGDFAIGAWIKSTGALAGEQDILRYSTTDATSQDDFGLAIAGGATNGDIIFWTRNGGNPFDTVHSNVNTHEGDNVWKLIIGCRDSGVNRLYVATVLQTDTAPSSYSLDDFASGKFNIGSAPFDGGRSPFKGNILNAFELDFFPSQAVVDRIAECGLDLGVDNIPGVPTPIFFPPMDETTVFTTVVDVISGNNGVMQNMTAANIESDVPVDPGCPSVDGLPARYIKRYATMFRDHRV